MNETINFASEHKEAIAGIATLVYEIVASIWPTSKNISLLDKAIKLFRFLVPNRSTKETVIAEIGDSISESTKNHVIKMIVIFMLCSVGSFAQLNTNVKSLNSYNTDSATVRSNTNTLQTAYGQIGTLYYNKQSYKWRVYQDSVWYDLVNASSGFALTNGSGTTSNGSAVDLGGTLSKNVDIDGNFDFNIGNTIPTSSFNAFADNINIASTGSTSLTGLTGVTISNDIGHSTSVVSGPGPNINFNNTSNNFFKTVVLPTGTTSLAPMQMVSGPLLTSKQIGRWGFLTDKLYFTISTGTAEKELTINDKALTSGRVPFVTTNGRLSDTGDFLWDNASLRLMITANPIGGLWLCKNAGSLVQAGVLDTQNLLFGDPQVVGGVSAIRAATGISAQPNGINFTVAAGSGLGSGNSNGGNLSLIAGTKNGTGTAGNVLINAGTGGFVIMSGLPTTCAGAPAGALANIAGVLNVCP